MPTRRRSDNAHQETWHVYFDDVHIGSIGERAGVPVDVDQWSWRCWLLSPVTSRDSENRYSERLTRSKRAPHFAAWAQIEPMVTDANFRH